MRPCFTRAQFVLPFIVFLWQTGVMSFVISPWAESQPRWSWMLSLLRRKTVRRRATAPAPPGWPFPGCAAAPGETEPRGKSFCRSLLTRHITSQHSTAQHTVCTGMPFQEMSRCHVVPETTSQHIIPFAQARWRCRVVMPYL